jgi:Na+/melibiose symporter-like transporter
MVVTSNLISAVGYFIYPAVTTYTGVFFCVFFVMIADRLYFASWPTLIARIARTDQLTAWFALVQTISAGCAGLGSLLSTVFLASGGPSAVKAIVIANACTSLIAAALTATQNLETGTTTTHTPSASPWAVLKNPLFRRLLLAQLFIATAWAIPGAFLPLYLTRALDLPHWSTTLVGAANYLLIFFLQLRLTHSVQRFGHTRSILIGSGFILASFCIMAVATLLQEVAAALTVFAGVGIYTVGEMLVLPATYALVSLISPNDRRGLYMSVFQITGVVAFGIGPGIVGWLFGIAPLAVLLVVSTFVGIGVCIIYLSRKMYSPHQT